LSTENQEIESPVHPEVTIRAATVENIIADKLAVCYRFRSGNTRMKDFDDLWRLSRSRIEIDVDRLKKLLRTKQVPKQLDVAWINPDLIRIWNTHQSRYPDLPLDPITLFSDVNKWLAEL
ncbi:MAG: nucleotidyl transferase AbiEii/AbiGii toxin family protein, partial [Deltaproteobacteria bacterium]|nr:nucleotidyl transferase AbiEii/AbiGii toxin family protein [Deltaproteobacteria bacterium]